MILWENNFWNLSTRFKGESCAWFTFEGRFWIWRRAPQWVSHTCNSKEFIWKYGHNYRVCLSLMTCTKPWCLRRWCEWCRCRQHPLAPSLDPTNGSSSEEVGGLDQTVLNHVCFGLDNKHNGYNKHIEPRFMIILTASWYPPCRTEFLASSHMSQLDNFHTWHHFWIIKEFGITKDFGIIKFFWII